MEALGINVAGLIFQIIAFGLLIYLLQRFAYKPVLKMLDQRAERIRESMETAERVQREMQDAEQRNLQEMDRARREAQAVIAQANEIAGRTVADARQQARDDGEKLIAKARAEINAEREQAVAEIRQLVADLAIAAASKVVRKSLDRNEHMRVIEEVLAETNQLKAS